MLGKRALAAAAVGVWLSLFALLSVQGGVFDAAKSRVELAREQPREAGHEAKRKTDREARATRSQIRRERKRVGRSLDDAIDSASGAVWRAVRVPALLLLISGAGLGAARIHSRRMRQAATKRFEIVLSREDLSSPFERQMMFSELAGVLSARWWSRLAFGPPSVAFEVHSTGKGGQRLYVATQERYVNAISGLLRARYPDVSLGRGSRDAPSWNQKIVRLKKHRPSIMPIQTLKDDEYLMIESQIVAMAEQAEPVSAQLVLTPAPAWLEASARRMFKRRERELLRLDHSRSDELGPDSVIEEKESKAALESQGRALYWFDYRVCARSREVARMIAGVAAGPRSENSLRLSYPIVRAELFRRRIPAAAGNLIPAWRKGVISASELSTLWALPRQRTRSARLRRSPVRRAPAPATIDNDPSRALLRDQSGRLAGIAPSDRKYGLALVGSQGVGKSTVLLRLGAADARDPNKAIVFCNPKDQTGKKLLELISPNRTVWHVDLARPEVGFNPLGVDAPPGAIADMIVAAFRETHGEESIMAASDSFLRQAIIAVCAIEEQPTFWHVYELLSPRRKAYRQRVVERLRRMPGMTATALYWGTTFPEMWMDGRTQLTHALNAPRNKIERVISTPSVDLLLRHPFTIDVAEVVRERGIIVIDGALGSVGADNATLVMQMVVQMVNQALKMQHELDPAERVPVSLIVDDAHRVLKPSWAEMVALHRSALLEATTSYQFDDQLVDRVLRIGAKSLQRSVSLFALGEQRLAREYADFFQEVYSDRIGADKENRERMAFGPEDMLGLPVYHAINSWVAGGTRRSPFLGTTMPVDSIARPELAAHHLDSQRERGASWPEWLPAPEGIGDEYEAGQPVVSDSGMPRHGEDDRPEVAGVESPAEHAEEDEAPDAPVVVPDRGASPSEPPDAAHVRDKTESETDEPRSPATYLAVHREDAFGAIFERRAPSGKEIAPEQSDLELLAALHRYKFLLASQIRREWWSERDSTTVNRRLRRLVDAKLVARFRPRTPVGRHEHIYQLARGGFDLARRLHGPDGPYLSKDAKWHERKVSDYRSIQHDLQVNAWVQCYRALAGELVVDWLGPDQGRVEVPTKNTDSKRQLIEADDISFGDYRGVEGLKATRFRPIVPDAVLTMDVPSRGRRFDLMIELDRTARPEKNFDKFRRYDAFLVAWGQQVQRYVSMGEVGAVVFVCVDDEQVRRFMEAADREVVGRVVDPTKPEAEWPYPGRERMLFVSERDVHEGKLTAWMLQRRPGGSAGDRAGEPRLVNLPGSSAS